jgi:hypothetical protein
MSRDLTAEPHIRNTQTLTVATNRHVCAVYYPTRRRAFVTAKWDGRSVVGKGGIDFSTSPRDLGCLTSAADISELRVRLDDQNGKGRDVVIVEMVCLLIQN